MPADPGFLQQHYALACTSQVHRCRQAVQPTADDNDIGYLVGRGCAHSEGFAMGYWAGVERCMARLIVLEALFDWAWNPWPTLRLTGSPILLKCKPKNHRLWSEMHTCRL